MIRLLMMVSLGLVLGGCKTQQVALDEANHGVALISELETSLADFRRIETHSLNARSASLRAQKDALAAVEKIAKRDMRIRAAVGDRATARILDTLLASTDALADEDAAYVNAAAQNEAAVAALLTPLPTTKESTSAAQTALAEMGKELGGGIRRAEFFAFWKAVKASVDKEKEEIAKAEVDASDSESK